jgi:glycine cleavage system H protein
MTTEFAEVAGFPVALDRAYDPENHLWVAVGEPARGSGGVPHMIVVARIGLDALGVETSGTLAQLAFVEVGEPIKRGEAFGSLEAAKFVGPLTSPLSGRVTATNEAVVADPRLVESDPYGAGWLIELTLSDPSELDGLVRGAEAIPDWFAAEVADYRLKGVLAE